MLSPDRNELTYSLDTTNDPNKTPVKDSWFKAFRFGNGLWPQTGVGIHRFTFAALLTDPPRSGREVAASVFTPAQVNKLGASMDLLHRNFGIPMRAFIPENSEGLIPVSEKRLQTLWTTAKSELLSSILYVMSPGEITTDRQSKQVSERGLDLLDDFFSDPESELYNNLKASVLKASEFLKSENSRIIARLHKLQFDKRRPPEVVREEVKRLSGIIGLEGKPIDYTILILHTLAEEL